MLSTIKWGDLAASGDFRAVVLACFDWLQQLWLLLTDSWLLSFVLWLFVFSCLVAVYNAFLPGGGRKSW